MRARLSFLSRSRTFSRSMSVPSPPFSGSSLAEELNFMRKPPALMLKTSLDPRSKGFSSSAIAAVKDRSTATETSSAIRVKGLMSIPLARAFERDARSMSSRTHGHIYVDGCRPRLVSRDRDDRLRRRDTGLRGRKVHDQEQEDPLVSGPSSSSMRV